MPADRNRLVIGIDPGAEYVGWSMARGHETPVYDWNQPNDFLMDFEDTTVSRIAMERYDMRQFTLESMRTVEVIGAIKWICKKKGIKIGFVNASDKRKFIGDIHPSITGHAREAEAIRLYDLAYGTWR